MAERPWATPSDVREYSENKDVRNRSDARLKVDITRAEAEIIRYCHHDFSSYKSIPEDVRTAVILLAEKYAYSTRIIKKGGITSETFDDYSYSADSGSYDLKIEDLGLAALLDSYRNKEVGSVNVALWRL